MKIHKSFKLTPELDKLLRAESERIGIPQTGIIEAALKKYFGQESTYALVTPNGKSMVIAVEPKSESKAA